MFHAACAVAREQQGDRVVACVPASFWQGTRQEQSTWNAGVFCKFGTAQLVGSHTCFAALHHRHSAQLHVFYLNWILLQAEAAGARDDQEQRQADAGAWPRHAYNRLSVRGRMCTLQAGACRAMLLTPSQSQL